MVDRTFGREVFEVVERVYLCEDSYHGEQLDSMNRCGVSSSRRARGAKTQMRTCMAKML